MSLGNELVIGVAANFAKPLMSLVEIYERQTDTSVSMRIASSGKLVAQISHGAPIDLFLSADQQRVDLLIEAGYALEAHRFTYAIGRLVYWRRGIPISDMRLTEAITASDSKLMIANPKLAPYGFAAQETLSALSLWQRMENALILAENVQRVSAAMHSGIVDHGFISLSLAINDPAINHTEYLIVPDHLHTPIRQDGAITADSKEARSFSHFMQSASGRKLILAQGYLVP